MARIDDLTVRNFNVDATFKVVPNGEFKQLLMIHIVHEEHAFPIIYVLMSRKTEEAYSHLLQYIEDNVCHLRPTSFMTDFESAMRNAIRTVYPNCIIYGCWFHFCQAIRLHCSKKLRNLMVFLKENANANQLFHKFLALPLVKLNLIPAACTHLRAVAETFGGAFNEFVSYFMRQWMRKVTPESFCVFQKASRTNNLVESHNSKLSKKMSPNGNFYKFVELLQKEAAIKSIEMGQVNAGALNVYSNPRNAMKTRNAKINKLQQKLNEGELGLEAFLSQITFSGNRII